ncbi:MAG TPA: hypothetical protein VNZ57_03960 [Longimicrobiales bacterium]|nr:hypothetical protein [Longimicrobiales bacterium]
MINRDDVQKLIHREGNDLPVLSVFLDMSVASDNKRTYPVVLNQWRSNRAELAGAANGLSADAVASALDAVDRWIGERYDESNRGVAVYAEVGGSWVDGYQVPLRLDSRATIQPVPVVGPLVRLLATERHHGIVLVDRQHLRMFSLYLGRSMNEHEVRTEPYPTPHDVKRGGYSAPDFQRRKAEEVRHFFKEFALEVGEFDRRYQPDDIVGLGTEENVRNFETFLAPAVREKWHYGGHAPIDATPAEVLDRIEPFLASQRAEQERAALTAFRERVDQSHLAAAGVRETLERLQEGKVDTLLLAHDAERAGEQCTRCGYYLVGPAGACPYCGGPTRTGVDLIEAMIRLGEEQDLNIQFASASELGTIDGAGALLRF